MEIDGVWLLDKRSSQVEIRLNWKGRMQMWGASLAGKSASYPDDKRSAWVLVGRKEKVNTVRKEGNKHTCILLISTSCRSIRMAKLHVLLAISLNLTLEKWQEKKACTEIN